MLQAHAAKGVLTSSKTGPLWTGQDWEQSTLTYLFTSHVLHGYCSSLVLTQCQSATFQGQSRFRARKELNQRQFLVKISRTS